MAAAEDTISEPLNYSLYIQGLVLLFNTEPYEVSAGLDELRDALARTKEVADRGDDTAELAHVKNLQIALQDTLNAYAEHGFPVPQALDLLQRRLARRRGDLDLNPPPQGHIR